MASQLCFSVTFLGGAYHGRKDARTPEWPPSPLRLFQALLATAMRGGAGPPAEVLPAFRWLEAQPPPTIVAPSARPGQPMCLSVPNNAMDIVGRAWARGNVSGKGDANPATHRAMKNFRPMIVDAETPMHFLWPIPENATDDILGFVERLTIITRQLVALGWGIDLVAGRAKVLSAQAAAELTGENWAPTPRTGGTELRTPLAGTVDALLARHELFLARCTEEGLSPAAALSPDAFAVNNYRRDFEPSPRLLTAFQLLDEAAEKMRPFDLRQPCVVAGMMRHAVANAAENAGWSSEKVARFVLGHGEAKDERPLPVGAERFAFLPLPSLEGRGPGKSRVAGSIRRMLVTCLGTGGDSEIAWARRAMSGRDLIDKEEKAQALLTLIPASDNVVRDYIRKAATWATVSPVILPGWDDRASSKTESLLRKAIVQAGYSEYLARHAELEYRPVGFLKGVEHVRQYRVPDHLQQYPRYHVRLTWRDAAGQRLEITGPICLGGGRYGGTGLFAAIA